MQNRPRLGRKAAIRLRQNEVVNQAAIENSTSISKSLKQRTELLAEKNAMIAFNRDECETEEDLRDRAEFLRMIQKKYMRPMIEKEQDDKARAAPTSRIAEATVVEDEGAGGENGSENADDSDKSE